MNPWLQTWHIFKKDAKHLWPEIAVSFVLLAAFAWVAPWQWPHGQEPGPSERWVELTAGVLRGLLPLVWAILIARVVHEEGLVGTRASWLTKPYNRLSLLGAKVLFIAVFLCLPFLAMQVYLLAHAGILNRQAIFGLFFNISFVCLAILLPFTALATVTRGFGRFFLAFLGTVIYLVLLFLGLEEIDSTRLDGSYSLDSAAVILLLMVVTAIVLHYTRRRTLLSRSLLLSAPLVAALIALVPDNAVYHEFYPNLSPTADFNPSLSFKPREESGFRPYRNVEKGFVKIVIPYKGEGFSQEDRLMGKAVHVTIESANGQRWTSPWQAYPEQIVSESSLGFQIPKRILDRIGESPVKLSMSIAVEHFVPLPPVTFHPEGGFSAPGGVVCRVYREFPHLACRYPALLSQVMLIRAPLTHGECPHNGSPKSIPDNAAEDSLDIRPGDPMFLDPVSFVSPALYLMMPPTTPQIGWNSLCPGAPLTLISYRSVGQMQLHLRTESLVLTRYMWTPMF